MTSKRLIILLILTILISWDVIAQKVFREGYIIKNSGESFTGLVGFNPDSKFPSICLFKRFDIAYEVTYGPEQLKAFGYKDGKRYESVEIGGKTTFYETLVKGELTVYNKGSNYLLKKGDLPPVEIKDGMNIWVVEGSQKEFGNLTELLKFLTNGSGIDIKENLVIKEDLVPVVVAYDKVSGESWNQFNRNFSEKDLSLQAWRSGANRNIFRVFGGINTYLLKISPSKPNIFTPVPEPESGIMIGLSYERVISGKSDKLALRADMLFLNQSFYTYNEKMLITGGLSRDDSFFGFSAIKIPLLLQYSFTGRRIIPYLNGGVSGMIFLDKYYTHISEIEEPDVFGSDIRISEDHKMIFRFGEISATLGAGVKIRILNSTILNIEGRFELGTGLFNSAFPNEMAFSQYSMQPSLLIGFNF